MISGEYYSLRREIYATESTLTLSGPGWNEPPSKQLMRVLKETLIAFREGMRPTFSNLRFAL
jgi:hypothetical protein